MGYATRSVQGGGARGPMLLALLAALSHGRELVAADSGHPHPPASRVEILHPQELQTTIQTVGFRYYGNHPPRPRTTPSCRHHPGTGRHSTHTPTLATPPTMGTLPTTNRPPPHRLRRAARRRGAQRPGALHERRRRVPGVAHAHRDDCVHSRPLSVRFRGRVGLGTTAHHPP